MQNKRGWQCGGSFDEGNLWVYLGFGFYLRGEIKSKTYGERIFI